MAYFADDCILGYDCRSRQLTEKEVKNGLRLNCHWIKRNLQCCIAAGTWHTVWAIMYSAYSMGHTIKYYTWKRISALYFMFDAIWEPQNMANGKFNLRKRVTNWCQDVLTNVSWRRFKWGHFFQNAKLSF